MSSAFRITQGTIARTALRNLQPNLARMAEIQEQLSSGKSLRRPSDSPSGTIAALRLRADLRRTEQHTRNGDDGLGWLGQADTALSGALESVRSVRNLALQGQNAAMGTTARESLAVEVEALRDNLLAIANTEYLGQPIFAGTSGATAAYDAAGAYLGDAGTISRPVAAGVTVQVNMPGTDVFGPGGSDIFQALTDVAAHLRSDPAQLGNDLDTIDAGFLRMQNALSTVGSRYHQIELMQARTESNKVDTTNQLSEVEGVDLAAAVVELQLQEVAYQAALGATAKIIQPSLVDFLR